MNFAKFLRTPFLTKHLWTTASVFCIALDDLRSLIPLRISSLFTISKEVIDKENRCLCNCDCDNFGKLMCGFRAEMQNSENVTTKFGSMKSQIFSFVDKSLGIAL